MDQYRPQTFLGSAHRMPVNYSSPGRASDGSKQQNVGHSRSESFAAGAGNDELSDWSEPDFDHETYNQNHPNG
jgi:hypothetical protein